MAAPANEIKLFNKFTTKDVNVTDISLVDYIAVKDKYAVYVPVTYGRYNKRAFKKAQCPIVERLVNALMFHGRNTSKKLQAARIVQHALEIIALLTRANPVAILAEAVSKGGCREDSTRIGTAGVVRRQAVDVAPLRRVSQAVFLIAEGARNSAFRNLKSIAECLADEIMNCAKDNQNSYTIKKKDELERIAKLNR